MPVLERTILGVGRAVLRFGRQRIGPAYAEEIGETLALRAADAERLPAGQRLRWALRELAALMRLARGRKGRTPGLPRSRDEGPSPWVRRFLQMASDTRVALRQLRRDPAFTVVTVAILALGIGVNSAMFSVVNAVLVRPLPYAEPERLVRVSLENPSNRFNLSVADFLALREESAAFASVAGYTINGSTYYLQTFKITLTGGTTPEVVTGTWVTAGYFETLGAAPMLGRTARAGEDTADADPAVVVSHAFWRDRLDADPDALGTVLEINDIDHVIVGVMPPGFSSIGNLEAQLWPTFRMLEPRRRGPFFLTVVARLADGWTEARAAEALVPLQSRVMQRWSDSFNGTETSYVTSDLRGEILGTVGETVWVLFGAVALVLLIALANVANLMLTRATRRSREYALRSALGAGRGRLAIQALLEGACLAAGGALGGLVLGNALLQLLLRQAPMRLPRQEEIALDLSVVAFATGLALAAALVLALIPARRLVGGPAEAMRDGARGATTGSRALRIRSLLVLSEVALAVPLLVGALVMVSTLVSLQQTDLGFRTEHLLTMRLDLPVEKYDEEAVAIADLNELLNAGRAVAGAETAALGSSLPPDRLRGRNNFRVRGEDDDPRNGLKVAHYASVSADYFETLGIPLLSGRLLAPEDRVGGEEVAVVDQAFVDTYLPGLDPLRVELQFGGCRECPWSRVVGVVGSVRFAGIDQEAEPSIYRPLEQEFQPSLYLALRTTGDPASAGTELRALVADAVPGLAGTELRATPELLAESVAMPRYRTVLLGLFAGLAVVLAVVGIYGVVSQFVVQHTRELGVRKAVGAKGVDIVGLVLRRAAGPLGVGLVIGAVLSSATANLLRNLVYGVDASSLPITIVACVLLSGAALVATLAPARRAAGVDPVEALRAE